MFQTFRALTVNYSPLTLNLLPMPMLHVEMMFYCYNMLRLRDGDFEKIKVELIDRYNDLKYGSAGEFGGSLPRDSVTNLRKVLQGLLLVRESYIRRQDAC